MMNNSKNSENRSAASRQNEKKKSLILVLSFIVAVVFAVAATSAYLIVESEPTENTFALAQVTGKVTEDFDGTVKKNVNVRNDSTAAVYVRVKLLSSMVDADGNMKAVDSSVPIFTPGEGWVASNGYYYYTKPVGVGESPDAPLIGADGITLITDTATGTHQVIDVLAQCIQAEGMTDAGAKAVVDAWGVDPSSLGSN